MKIEPSPGRGAEVMMLVGVGTWRKGVRGQSNRGGGGSSWDASHGICQRQAEAAEHRHGLARDRERAAVSLAPDCFIGPLSVFDRVRRRDPI